MGGPRRTRNFTSGSDHMETKSLSRKMLHKGLSKLPFGLGFPQQPWVRHKPLEWGGQGCVVQTREPAASVKLELECPRADCPVGRSFQRSAGNVRGPGTPGSRRP
jgi:hypothetical protein